MNETLEQLRNKVDNLQTHNESLRDQLHTAIHARISELEEMKNKYQELCHKVFILMVDNGKMIKREPADGELIVPELIKL